MIPSRSRILLIEGDSGDAFILTLIFKRHAMDELHVEHVHLLSEGLAELADQTYDLVLLGLPGSADMTSVRKVRQAAPHVPVVVLTGLDDPAVAEHAARAGAAGYIVKGGLGDELLVRSLQYTIERHRTGSDVSSLRVLLVEDNPVTLLVERSILESQGLLVTATSDATSALTHLRSQEEFDCLVTDFDMPGLNGLELISLARTIDSDAALMPMMILSARDQPSDRQAATAAGSDYYLVKGALDSAQLAAIIRALVAQCTETHRNLEEDRMTPTVSELLFTVRGFGRVELLDVLAVELATRNDARDLARLAILAQAAAALDAALPGPPITGSSAIARTAEVLEVATALRLGRHGLAGLPHKYRKTLAGLLRQIASGVDTKTFGEFVNAVRAGLDIKARRRLASSVRAVERALRARGRAGLDPAAVGALAVRFESIPGWGAPLPRALGCRFFSRRPVR